ncbi:MBL fold metallo-hydrolase [Rhodoblastus acidophilus]|uniref:MBL fold metallo-hydrolase n=1 Tax=Candidatus Rhodoblastus alkanivorans TaxID=2954117 RepID=A0ABS9Z3J4_9HYPH|nr:MBL fold metallo-hydrolase [Candidatus Rhodoblastus alkanivorans]MCI4678763.1 MBL fold metallo-hydrolase [Candidatus Rhodoblastus alkanivorans]MCI4682152.1 MBL fold metallo-hydrolase [Candidatus Rhodoblastus alkanivorans]MDI4639454.1 MBL fold metallo-hydrolase [Rhodoblastus acidophilus]
MNESGQPPEKTRESLDEAPRFDLAFDASAGRLLRVSPLVRRIVAPNPGPFTFTGTCTYVIGEGEVAVVDPGPDLPAHVEALLDALKGEKVAAIAVTHTHRDHSPAARHLQQATGAEIIGCAPHHSARDLVLGEINKLDAANDLDHKPDRALADGDVWQGAGFALRAVATPGHTMNHVCLELVEEKALFTGDHIMGWSTSIVAPPDGAMRLYMDSLEKLRAYDHDVYWPGHGGPVTQPQRFVRALLHHRRAREKSILAALGGGALAVPEIVEKVYEKLDPRLIGAAALSTFAHLEDLFARGLVQTEAPPQLGGRFRLA